MSQLCYNHLLIHNKRPYLSLTITFFHCLVCSVIVLHCCYDHFPARSLKCRLLSSILRSENNPKPAIFYLLLKPTELEKEWNGLWKSCRKPLYHIRAEVSLYSSFSPSHTPAQTHPQSQLLSSCTNLCPLPFSLTLPPGFKHCESGLSSPALHRWTAPVMGHDWPQ